MAQSWLNLKQASSAKRQTYELAGALVVIFQSYPTHYSDHVHEKQKGPNKDARTQCSSNEQADLS